jgi:hypothetical protein
MPQRPVTHAVSEAGHFAASRRVAALSVRVTTRTHIASASVTSPCRSSSVSSMIAM